MYSVVGILAEKGGWLSNIKLFIKNGLIKVNEIEPYFTLYA